MKRSHVFVLEGHRRWLGRLSIHGLLCVLVAANVDLETDSKIQAAIRTVFRASTVITVAHRLGRLSFLATRRLIVFV